MLGRPFVKLCHRFAKMQCKKPRRGDFRPSTLDLALTAFVLSSWPPLRCPVALVVRGQAKARTTRPPESPAHARYTGGEEPGALSHRPPREDLPHPGRPPHSRDGFWPGRRSGRKARAGHRPGGKAQPAFPAFPPPRLREGGGPAIPDVCSATDFQPTHGANASPTRKPLSRAGRHTRLLPPLPPRTRGREWLPLPPRNVNATSVVAVMPRVYAHRQPAQACAAAATAQPGTGQAHTARLSGSGPSETLSLRDMPQISGRHHYSFTAATPMMRLGVWDASSLPPRASSSLAMYARQRVLLVQPVTRLPGILLVLLVCLRSTSPAPESSA